MRNPGASRTKARASGTTPPSRCSQLSSTNRSSLRWVARNSSCKGSDWPGNARPRVSARSSLVVRWLEMRHHGRHERRFAGGSQFDDPGAARIDGRQTLGEDAGEAGLADAAGSAQGHQRRLVQSLQDSLDVGLPPKQRWHRRWQVAALEAGLAIE